MKGLLLALILCGALPAWSFQPYLYVLIGDKLIVFDWKTNGTSEL